ncbi:MAG: class I SAM-dependent methyltransferase [Polyangiaceae bacterium]
MAKMRGKVLGLYLGDLSDTKHYVKLWLGLGEPFDTKHFEERYAKEDPFNYENSPYDELKRQLVRFGFGDEYRQRLLDVGSGEGYLAAHLRDKFDSIDLLDASGAAVERARARVDRPGFDLPGDLLTILPTLEEGAYDGIVVSEVFYYLGPVPFGRKDRLIRNALARALRPGGRLVLVHPLPQLYHATWRRDSRFSIEGRAVLNTGRNVEMLALNRTSRPA